MTHNLGADRAVGLMATDHSGFPPEFKPEQRLAWVLAGGDDYELLFTAPAPARSAVAAAARSSQTAVSRIGRIDSECGLRLVNAQGQAVANPYRSFDHFA